MCIRDRDDTGVWEGTATELIKDMGQTENLSALVGKFIPSRIILGKDLMKLVNQGPDWISSKVSNRGRLYTIKAA